MLDQTHSGHCEAAWCLAQLIAMLALLSYFGIVKALEDDESFHLTRAKKAQRFIYWWHHCPDCGHTELSFVHYFEYGKSIRSP